MTIFRELRDGQTEDGKTRAQVADRDALDRRGDLGDRPGPRRSPPTSATATLRADDVAAGLVGAVVKDPVQDRVALARVPGDGRQGARRLAGPVPRLPRGRLTAWPMHVRLRHPPPRPGLGAQPARGARRARARRRPDRGAAGRPDGARSLVADPGMRPPVALLVYAPDDVRARGVLSRSRRSRPSGRRCATRSRAACRCASSTSRQSAQLGAADEPRQRGADGRPRRPARRLLAEAAGDGDGERWWDDGRVAARRARRCSRPCARRCRRVRERASPTRRTRARPSARRPCGRPSARARRGGLRADRRGVRRLARPRARDARRRRRRRRRLLRASRARKVPPPGCPGRTAGCRCESGYGAGIESPGWYDHLFSHRGRTSSCAGWRGSPRLLRGEDLDASSGARDRGGAPGRGAGGAARPPARRAGRARRGRRAPCCARRPTRRCALVHERLIVGERLGEVPRGHAAGAAAGRPRARAAAAAARPEAGARTIDLDLRRDDRPRDRSHLLHRLALLGIRWGAREQASASAARSTSCGELRWEPEFAVALIEARRWGTTLVEAATAARCASRGRGRRPCRR